MSDDPKHPDDRKDDPKNDQQRARSNPFDFDFGFDDAKESRHERDHRGGLWERTVGKRLDGIFRRVVAGSMGSLFMSEDGLKQTLSDLKMPKEVIQSILQQAENTKKDLLQLLAREMRDFLEVSNFYEEIQRILTSLSFEIRTEIRMIPNDQAIKPEIKNKWSVRRNKPEPEETSEAAPEEESEPEPEVPKE